MKRFMIPRTAHCESGAWTIDAQGNVRVSRLRLALRLLFGRR